MPRPAPRLAPVTTATRPFSLDMALSRIQTEGDRGAGVKPGSICPAPLTDNVRCRALYRTVGGKDDDHATGSASEALAPGRGRLRGADRVPGRANDLLQ